MDLVALEILEDLYNNNYNVISAIIELCIETQVRAQPQRAGDSSAGF